VIAADVVTTNGERVTGPVLSRTRSRWPSRTRSRWPIRVLWWDRTDPRLDTVAAVLDVTECTNTVHHYRRLAGWLAVRNPAAWWHLLDVLDELGDNLTPVGPAPATGPVSPTMPRPLAPVRAGWFVD